MLILTTNVFTPDQDVSALTDWPGPIVLVVLPDSGLDHDAIKALNDTFIVVELLEPMTALSPVLCDIVRWMKPQLRLCDGPLLCLDCKITPDAPLPDPGTVPPYAIQSVQDDMGRISRLVLGEMVVSSPLLPGFVHMINGRKVDDALFADLLTDAFAWG